MITKNQKEIAQWVLNLARKKSCEAVRVSMLTSTNNSFEYRNTQLDNLHQSTQNKLYVEVYIDGKYGSFSSNRIEKAELESFIDTGIASTKYLAEDKCRRLPDAERYYKDKDGDLDIFDSAYANLPASEKLAVAKQAVEEVYGSDERIISVSSSYSDDVSAEYVIASNGLEVESQETSFILSAEVSLKSDGHARAEDYWYDSKIYWSDLQTKGIGLIAKDRALRKIGQRKIASGRYTMLLDNTTSSRLFSPLLQAMTGVAIHQKNSFLIDKLGKKITSNKLSIVDCPHIKRAFGARLYDGEGVKTASRSIIEDGVLQTYFIDTYYSLKMEIEPTISSPSVMIAKLGNKNFNELLQSVQKGIWVTGFNGGNTNPTTGDFSFGIEGFLVEDGVIKIPVSEMNITGNLLELWDSLVELGNDPREISSSRIPSLIFDNVAFSGL